MSDPTPPPAMPFSWFGVVDRAASSGLSGLEFLQEIQAGRLPAAPFYQAGEMWLAEAKAGEVVFTGIPSERFYNLVGTVHGGWISLLLDSAMAVAVISTLRPGETFTTLEIKVNFVRGVTAQTGPLRAEGRIVHRGGRVATSESRAYDPAGKLIAHSTCTCLILEVKS